MRMNIPFKVKSTTIEKHDEMLAAFKEMLEGWKHKKEGRDYIMIDNRKELKIEITAKVK